jgi:hypothetical protein
MIAMVSMVSCKSIEKMVEKGQYDEAILFAAEKLQGEVDKETKYVKALEEAFFRVMREDLDQIERYERSNRKEYYGDIYDLYRKIEIRQARIRPFLPLISEDGYVATFQMIDPRNKLIEYSEKDAEYHYNRAVELLETYAPNRKEKARNAYSALGNIGHYFDDYKDVEDLKDKAYHLGKEHVLITTAVANRPYLTSQHDYLLSQFNVEDLDRKWIEFHSFHKEGVQYDYEVVLNIGEVLFDREREVVNNYQREKVIQDGFRYVLDNRGNVMKDSLGNDIKEPNMITIRAQITEIERLKNAEIIAQVEVIDLRDDRIVDRQELRSPVIFRGYSSFFKGDRRAIDKRTYQRMDNFLEPYPSDYDMVYEGLMDIQKKARKKIKRVFS